MQKGFKVEVPTFYVGGGGCKYFLILNSYFRGKIKNGKKKLEDAGIDPATSHMLSARSTIWANPPRGNIKL